MMYDEIHIGVREFYRCHRSIWRHILAGNYDTAREELSYLGTIDLPIQSQQTATDEIRALEKTISKLEGNE